MNIVSIDMKRNDGQQDIIDAANTLIEETNQGNVDAVMIVMIIGDGIGTIDANGRRRLSPAERIGILSIVRTQIELEELGK